jgi:antirestriction protein
MAVNGIDTRELQEELDELIARRDDEDQIDPLDEDEAERLTAIEELLDEVGPEAQYGVFLINEGSFEEYAQELADDIGAIPKDAGWPTSYIDWEAAADALRMDYSSVTFDGTDWLYR